MARRKRRFWAGGGPILCNIWLIAAIVGKSGSYDDVTKRLSVHVFETVYSRVI
jgi:hypothetical protein